MLALVARMKTCMARAGLVFTAAAFALTVSACDRGGDAPSVGTQAPTPKTASPPASAKERAASDELAQRFAAGMTRIQSAESQSTRFAEGMTKTAPAQER